MQAATVEDANGYRAVGAVEELQSEPGQAVVEDALLVHLELALGGFAFIAFHHAGRADECFACAQGPDGALQELGGPQVVIVVDGHKFAVGGRQSGVRGRLHIPAAGGEQHESRRIALQQVREGRSLQNGAGGRLVPAVVDDADRVVGEGLLGDIGQGAAQETGAVLRADQNSYGGGGHSHLSIGGGRVKARELTPL